MVDIAVDVDIRDAKPEDLDSIKDLVDTLPELDTDEETYSFEYFNRLREDGLVLVAVDPEGDGDNNPVGVCFGRLNSAENWADMLGIAVRTDW